MRKKMCSLILASACSAALVVPAWCMGPVHAEELTGSRNWLVEFDGEEMQSNFSSDEMAEEIYGILPGDTMDLQVAIKNSGEEAMDWYLSNEILQSLEEGSEAEGGAYTYRLVYTDDAGEETILYDSNTVGGEGASQSGEGLHQATDALEDFLYLDQLAPGADGEVNLSVTLDGETQGNGYQNTLAALQMNFAAETAAPETITQKGEDQIVERTERGENTVTTVYETQHQTPKTGDTAPLLILSALMLFSGIVLLVFAVLYYKKHRRSGEGGLQS